MVRFTRRRPVNAVVRAGHEEVKMTQYERAAQIWYLLVWAATNRGSGCGGDEFG